MSTVARRIEKLEKRRPPKPFEWAADILYIAPGGEVTGGYRTWIGGHGPDFTPAEIAAFNAEREAEEFEDEFTETDIEPEGACGC